MCRCNRQYAAIPMATNSVQPAGKVTGDREGKRRETRVVPSDRDPSRRGDVLGPRANPLAANEFRSRADVAAAVPALYEPLAPFIVDAARVRLGSFGAVFEQASAELEGFARPLYGVVPLVAGGGEFAHWDRIRAGLVAGTDPDHPGYWGAVDRDADQRMVEQAAIGIALAFCPEHVWEPLDDDARARLVDWLLGIGRHEPVQNNWQFFRVLVALGLEQVGQPLEPAAVDRSLEMLDGYRRGTNWYVDGVLGNVDYYVPMAFHTYGLIYAAANDLGLGDADRAADYRARSRGFASDFAHWFGRDGAAVAMGRSLTYRFATASFWGALGWADVEPDMGWGAAKGMLLRHLRWWSNQAISDRDGVLSVGYAYDNRTLRESYNSPGSPYWCMKAFACLGAPADHPFWRSAEADHPADPTPTSIPDAGWLTRTDDTHTVALIANPAAAIAMPEQASAKYRKFAYSSRFALCADTPDFVGRRATDSTLTVTDDEGNRHVRLGIDAAGIDADVDEIDGGVAWSTWRPCPGVRIDSVCWFDGEWHLRVHRIATERPISTVESGFALGRDAPSDPAAARSEVDTRTAAAASWDGDSRIVDLSGRRHPAVLAPAVDAGLVHPHTVVPVLSGDLEPGVHEIACAVRADVAAPTQPPSLPDAIPASVTSLLERLAAAPIPTD